MMGEHETSRALMHSLWNLSSCLVELMAIRQGATKALLLYFLAGKAPAVSHFRCHSLARLRIKSTPSLQAILGIPQEVDPGSLKSGLDSVTHCVQLLTTFYWNCCVLISPLNKVISQVNLCNSVPLGAKWLIECCSYNMSYFNSVQLTIPKW